MARMFAIVGDTTTGGGAVVSGSPFTDVDGVAVARVGDRVACGRHGVTEIVSGDVTLIIDGQPVARHGDYCACGCRLLTLRQRHVYVDDAPGAGASADASPAAAVVAASQADKPAVCEACLRAAQAAAAAWLER